MAMEYRQTRATCMQWITSAIQSRRHLTKPNMVMVMALSTWLPSKPVQSKHCLLYWHTVLGHCCNTAMRECCVLAKLVVFLSSKAIDTGAVQHTLLCWKHLHVLVACMLCTIAVLLSDVAPPLLPLFLAFAFRAPLQLCCGVSG